MPLWRSKSHKIFKSKNVLSPYYHVGLTMIALWKRDAAIRSE